MDWPLIGAVSAVTIVAGVVTFEAVVLLQSDPAPIKKAPQLASVAASVERSAYEIPGFATGRPGAASASFPLTPLIDPDRSFAVEGQNPADQALTSPPPKKTPAASGFIKTDRPSELKIAKLATPDLKLTTPDLQPRAEQWRVTVTSKASYFNLGGHVDKAGIVDSLASSHLREAFKSHRNFAQLPAEIRMHILSQNINLPKIAPFRGLVGIDDKTLEEEQGVKFERIVSNR
jgi:hypothetical protein